MWEGMCPSHVKHGSQGELASYPGLPQCTQEKNGKAWLICDVMITCGHHFGCGLDFTDNPRPPAHVHYFCQDGTETGHLAFLAVYM